MSSLSLLHFADKRLKHKANNVVQFDDNLKSLAAALIEAMQRLNLISICAPQVGIGERITIIPDGQGQPFILVNPELIHSEGEITVEEDCNVFPHIVFNTARKHTVKVAYNDIHGAFHEQTFSEYPAALLQQHLDHFEGKLMIDFLSALKKERFIKQYEKMLAGGHDACHHGCSH